MTASDPGSPLSIRTPAACIFLIRAIAPALFRLLNVVVVVIEFRFRSCLLSQAKRFNDIIFAQFCRGRSTCAGCHLRSAPH